MPEKGYPASLMRVRRARVDMLKARQAYKDAVVAAWRDERSFTSIALAAEVSEAAIRMLLRRGDYRKDGR